MSKPFNLEEFKAGREAITRDGRRASFEYLSDGDIKYRLIVRIDGLTVLVAYSVDGFVAPLYQSDFDLIRMAPVRRELWARAYRWSGGKIDSARSARLSTNRQRLEADRPYETEPSGEWAQDSEPVLVYSWEEE